MDNEKITPVNATDREYRKKRVEELGSALAQIRARVKANRGSSSKKEDDAQQSGSSKPSEDTERTAMMKKILEEDRARFTKLQQNRVKMKETMDQIMIEREEQKKVEKQLQEAIAKVTAPTPELPPLIKQRIIDLETTVENLKERLSEKDKVLSSKTQSLTVLHSQLMQRSQEQVERAMAFTQEVSTIKEDFGKREELLKKEICRLKEREEELECRLSDKEIHTNEIESLQSELNEMRKELHNSLAKNDESSKSLESLNKLNLKFKAQLKAFKIERDKLKQAQDDLEDVEALKNRIALLEEEKGNLQLQLVDFDEFKESLHQAVNKEKFLEEELNQLRRDFKNLEAEKNSLQESFESANQRIYDQEDSIKSLRSSLKEMEEHKISAEMRSIEIEEKMEKLQFGTNIQVEQLMSQIDSLRSELSESNNVVDFLTNQLALKEQEISDIKGNNFPGEVEADSRLREIESYNSELVEKVRELQLKSDGHENSVIQLNDLVGEKNEIINNLKVKNEDLKMVITDLNNNKTILENEIQRLKVNEKEILKRENPTQDSTSSLENKEDPNLIHKFKKLAANYKIKTKLLQELENNVKSLTGEIEEKNNLIVELRSQVDESKEKVELLTKEVESVGAINGELTKCVEQLAPKLEEMEAERSTAQVKADRMNRAFEELIEWKEGDAKLLKEQVTSVNSMASNVSLLEQELKNLQSIVNEKNSVIGELETERKKLVEDMRNSEVELERLRGLYQQESVKNQNFLTNLQGLESEMLVSREEMNQIAEQLDAVTKNYNMCLGNLHERENYIEVLEQDIVIMKAKMYNLESGIEDKHRMLDRCSARLEEAEILTQAFDKYQAEMDLKIKKMSENENSMKTNLELLQNELDNLNKLNSELNQKNESSTEQMKEMTDEIKALKDIKNSYNSTLDRVEVLNEELKQVMSNFETKEEELMRLSEERADLFNKLSDLEDAYSDLKGQLEESQEATLKLKSQLLEKETSLRTSNNEVNNLQILLDDLKARRATPNESNLADSSSIKEDTVQVISWDQFNQGGSSVLLGTSPEKDNLRDELDEKIKLLTDAEKLISVLQLELTSCCSQKDAEILHLKQEINRILQEYEHLQLSLNSQKELIHPEKEAKMFSWEDYSHEESNPKFQELKKALQEVSKELKTIVNSISDHYSSELFSILLEIKKTLKGDESTEDTLFSWSTLDQTSSQNLDSLNSELQDKTNSLNAAQQEIANLQSALSSMLSEKESEVSALNEEILKLLVQKEEIEKMLNAEKSVDLDTKPEEKMFLWTQHNQDLGRDEEDGWGWIGAEANLEQDHKHSEALQIQTLTQRVKELEDEQANLNEKLNSSKMKCVKLLKKLKEVEKTNDQEQGEKFLGTFGLDLALQEEMRSQLDQAENKNQELSNELSTIKFERNHLNEKVNVLVTANERLIEMKERQDIEVQMWQKRSEELKNQVQGLQWSLEEIKSEIPSLNKGEDELKEKFNVLVAENEELQGIICNLKDGRPIGSPDASVELALLKEELKRLKEVRTKEKDTLQSELQKANEEIDAVEQQVDLLTKENQNLKSQINELERLRYEINNLHKQIQTLSDENKHLQELSIANNFSNDQDKIELLASENSQLKSQISHLNEQLTASKKVVGLEGKEDENHEKQISSTDNSNENVSPLIQNLQIENAELKEKLASIRNYDSEKIQDIDDSFRQQLDSVMSNFNLANQTVNNVVTLSESLKQEMPSLVETKVDIVKNEEQELLNIGNNLMAAQTLLNIVATTLSEIRDKCNLYILTNTETDKLKIINSANNYIIVSMSKLEKDIGTLKEKLSSLNQTPVFKGFSTLQSDPFKSLQANAEADQYKIHYENLMSLNKKYEQDITLLSEEKATYEQFIANLKEELCTLRSEHTDEMLVKFDKANIEMQKWKDETNSLRHELAKVIEQHSQQIGVFVQNEKLSNVKLSEVEENYKNFLLNKEQENDNLKQIIYEKEQLLANEIDGKNALDMQYKALTQNLLAAENRIGILSKENEQLQNDLNNKGIEQTVIEKQQNEIAELTIKLDQTQSLLKNFESLNDHLNQQVNNLSDKLKQLDTYNMDLLSKVKSLSDEISNLESKINSLNNKNTDLENIISQKQIEIDSINSQLKTDTPALKSDGSDDIKQLSLQIRAKDDEISRISQVLLDTQKRLVLVQDSKPLNKILSLQTKLDQALSALHNRDVRCYELTQEIMQLLGERDSLQLRLSESLRENEVIREKTAVSSVSASPELKSKLVELRRGYEKDPVVQLEMEDRHNQQMNLYTEKMKEDTNTSVDYGMFNWFFSTPSSPPQQQ